MIALQGMADFKVYKWNQRMPIHVTEAGSDGQRPLGCLSCCHPIECG